jgi:uncharacterized protein YecE (DUF72 family)
VRTGDLLAYYSHKFRTVEVNMTFYRFPSIKAVHHWYESTPEGFTFAVKMNRAITHYRKLRGVERYVDSFISSLSPLEEKLGPVLVQLPPDLSPDHALLERFLSDLPRPHDYAIEFRDREWLTSRTYAILEKYSVAAVLADPPPPGPEVRSTADLCYVRWHGRQGPGYVYPRSELKKWAELLQSLSTDRVFGYFNNDVGAAAPRNARSLLGLLHSGSAKAIEPTTVGR